MGDMREAFDMLKEFNKERRAKNFENFKSLEEVLVGKFGFLKHTEWHYSCILNCDKLEYWPTSSKWRWRRRNYNGRTQDLIRFMQNRGFDKP